MPVIYSEKGEILSSFVGKNGNATDNRWLFQAELTEKNDAQIVEKFQHSGFASIPPTGNKIVVQRISNAYVVSVAEYDEIVNDDLGEGELRIYGSASGSIVCEIYLKNDGSIDIEAPANINITSPQVNVTGDVIADSGATMISLKNHYHQGNLGYPTGTSIMTGGGTTPSLPPTTNPGGDLITGSSISLDAHKHSQANDSNGDTEQDTSTPI